MANKNDSDIIVLLFGLETSQQSSGKHQSEGKISMPQLVANGGGKSPFTQATSRLETSQWPPVTNGC